MSNAPTNLECITLQQFRKDEETGKVNQYDINKRYYTHK